jgi:phenylacetate-coenzyme A ligase PaaK-like adenylate-forming protein
LSTFETLKGFVLARQRWARLEGDSLTRFQDARAGALLPWVQAHSGFYREHWANHDIEAWRDLPTVNKSLMMQNFARFNTAGISSEAAFEVALRAEQDRNFSPMIHGLTVGLSSGTSGHRGLFLVNRLEQAAWAGVILARTLPKFRLSGERIAFFLRSNSNLYQQVGRGRWLQFRYFDLMAPLEAAVQELNTLQPSILVAPPSMLELLAREFTAGRLRVRPESLISVAEVLEPQDRDRLEGVFQAPVRQIYQATEGLLAVSCRCNSLHLQEDIVTVQLEPVQIQPVQIQPVQLEPVELEPVQIQPVQLEPVQLEPVQLEPGLSETNRFTPIITDLWRRTQPIIRYRLNDVLRLQNQACACGSSWRSIAQIEGRSDDVLEFELLAGGLRSFFPDSIRRAILLADARILEYEAVQERPGHLRVHLEVQAGSEVMVRESLRAGIMQLLNQYACRPADLEIVFGLSPRAANVKRRRVRRQNGLASDSFVG